MALRRIKGNERGYPLFFHFFPYFVDFIDFTSFYALRSSALRMAVRAGRRSPRLRVSCPESTRESARVCKEVVRGMAHREISKGFLFPHRSQSKKK